MQRVYLTDGDYFEAWQNDDATAAALIFDSHHGWHNVYRVVDLAVSHGMQLSPEDGEIMGAYAAQRETTDTPFNVAELASEIADDAERYLNDHVTTEGFSFGWHDGEFFLANSEWWSQDS